MGFELAESFGWHLPEVLIYPTGGGTGLVGMWKAFAELEALGWIGPKRPRMVAVQAEGCAPLVRAFRSGAQRARDLAKRRHSGCLLACSERLRRPVDPADSPG